MCVSFFLRLGPTFLFYLELVQKEGKKRQPFILLLGSRKDPSQAFVIIDVLAVEQPYLVKVMCALRFYVLDLPYPN